MTTRLSNSYYMGLGAKRKKMSFVNFLLMYSRLRPLADHNNYISPIHKKIKNTTVNLLDINIEYLDKEMNRRSLNKEDNLG